MRKFFSVVSFVLIIIFAANLYGCTNELESFIDEDNVDSETVEQNNDEDIVEPDKEDKIPDPVDSENLQEEELKNFTFDISKLIPTKYTNVVEDLTILSIEPSIVQKDNLVDIEITYGKEGAEGYCGRFYAIEVYIDGIWYDIMNEYKSFVPGEYYVALDFPEDPIPMFEINKQTVPMTTAYKYLPVGRYRIVKNMYGWKAVEFIIE